LGPLEFGALAQRPHRCACALTNDIAGQLSNFGGEQAAWGPLELTNYGFDHRYHDFAHVITSPCP
jgi:hypothetical protein